MSENLTIRVPKGWKPILKKIAEADQRDISSLTRKDLIAAHPELKKVSRSGSL